MNASRRFRLAVLLIPAILPPLASQLCAAPSNLELLGRMPTGDDERKPRA